MESREGRPAELIPLRRLVVALVGIALVLAAGAAVVPEWKQAHADAAFRDQCRTTAAESAARNATVTGHGQLRVTVLGDSYAQGYLLRDPAQSWPSRLAGPLDARVTVRSLGGTGFATSPCGPSDTYADRIASVEATRPRLVVVEGGLNDVLADPDAIAAGLVRTAAGVSSARVVVVGPAAAPKWRKEAARVDRVLAETSERAGVEYVSTYRWSLSFASDGIHLTPASQRTFGDRVAEAIAG